MFATRTRYVNCVYTIYLTAFDTICGTHFATAKYVTTRYVPDGTQIVIPRGNTVVYMNSVKSFDILLLKGGKLNGNNQPVDQTRQKK